MPTELRQTRLPGVGTKFTVPLDRGGRLAVILHNDGKREIYSMNVNGDDQRNLTNHPGRDDDPNWR